MDFMKNISGEQCAFLDRLPKEEKERINAEIIAEQERRKGLLTEREVGELLNIGKDATRDLPLRWPLTGPLRVLHQPLTTQHDV